MTELHYWNLTDLAAQLRSRTVSSVIVTQHLLARIARLEPQLHSYVVVLHERALAQAQRADQELARGLYRSPLHGVPVAIKDIFYTDGAATTAGSRFLGECNPRWNATVVERLNDAGAVLLGKLAMTEGALSEHPPTRPAPCNPWKADYWTGVSSSGSAVATAAGLCYASIGTDTGGSIRMPSAACGLTGLKPTWGRVSRYGLFPLCETRDHAGPIARSAADAAALLGVIAGRDSKDPTSRPESVGNYLGDVDRGIQGLRLGIDWGALTDDVDPVVSTALQAAVEVFQSHGARIRAVTYPSPVNYLKIYFASTVSEIALAHAKTFPARADEYGAVLRKTIEAAASVTGSDVIRVEHETIRLCGEMANVFEDVDMLLLPVLPVAPQTVAQIGDIDPAQFILTRGRFTIPFNATGNPALALPCGYASNGMPLSLQLVGKHLAEDLLLRAAQAYQRGTDWHTRHPALP